MKGPLLFLNTEITANYPYLYVYGRLEDGRSVCAKTSNFYHYFYVNLGNHPFPSDLDESLHQAVTFGKIDSGIYVKDVSIVRVKSIMGYSTSPVPMFKITMISYKHVSLCQRIFESRGFATYEASIKYELRFMVDRKFGGYDWLTISKYWDATQKETHCAVEYEFDADTIEKCPDNRSDFHQTIVLSFDIEACKGGNGRGFVNPAEDSVSQIGNSLYDGAYRIIDRRVFALVPKGQHVTSLAPKIVVEEFEDEKQLLLAWKNYVVRRDVDIITGYNIKMFDFYYLFERAKALGIGDEFVLLGRLLDKKATIRKTAFQSAGKGARLDYSVSIDGRFDFDMIKSIKEQFDLKLRSYSLGFVANRVLGYQKVEMPYQNIPIYQAGTPDQRSHLCYYCWWDAELCYELMKKRMTLVNYIEAARVCGTPMKYFLDRGQQIHTTSLLLRYGNARGFVIPSSTESQNDEDTAGATVLTPKAGFYTDPIVTLDFRSLYPSIIEDSNICYSTKRSLLSAKASMEPNDYIVPPNTSGEYCFVKDHIMQGILPQMEQTLFAKRDEAKNEMKKEKDPEKKNVYNCKQNAIKVRMNSIYGFLKANTVCDKDLMEAVTGTGRWMLETSKDLVEKNFPGSTVVYGDSVTGDTPCLVFDTVAKWTLVRTIETLANDFVLGDDGKEYGTTRYLVWTEEGWTGIRRVIRHLTDKPIVRVLTHTGVVDCTTDHGLVRKNGTRVASGELNIGDELLHSYIDEWPQITDIPEGDGPKSENEAYVWGFFMADGSCDRYECPSGLKYSWAINKSDKSILEILRVKLEGTHEDVTFIILDTIESSQVYKLVPIGGLKTIVKRYRKHFYDKNKYKIVPDIVLNSPLNIRKAFWEGYYRGDGDKAFLRSDIKGKNGALGLYTLLRSIGYSVSVNTRTDKLDIYRLTATFSKQRKNPYAIKKIEQLETSTKYVYDLETENHHFHAGVGQMIVHNTDSIFIHFGKVSVDEAFSLGAKAAQMCTEFFWNHSGKKVHLLQREKLFLPFLLIGKKKYTGYKCLGPGLPFVRDETGLENVRRDNALIGSETLDTVAKMVIEEKDYTAERSIKYVHHQIRELLMGRIPISKLIISKNLSKSFKHYEDSGTMQPHVELAKKIAARAHETGEQLYYTGDRVPFVILAGSKGEKSALRAEDPLYALERRLPIDYRYYIENQMMRPLIRLLTPILAPQENKIAKGVGKNAFDVIMVTKVAESIKKTNKNGDKVNINMNELRGLTAYKALFIGSHMMATIQKVQVEPGKSLGMLGFVEKLDNCTNCRCGIGKRDRKGELLPDQFKLCNSCEPKRPLVHIKLQMELNYLEQKKWSTWTECQRCDKKLHGEVVCANKDCANFYERQKVILDLEDLQKKL